MKTIAATLLFAISWTYLSAGQLTVTDKGAHHRTFQTVKQIQTPRGLVSETNQLVELQGGLHRWTERGWVETHPGLELFQDGAVARNLSYGAIFAPNLATPNAIDLSLPDGARLQGHLVGLMLTEGNQSALIAEVKDCAGVIGGPEQNELTFADAFTDFDISVKYVLHRDRISQLVTLHNQFHPNEWGLGEDAVLEILSEFTTFPELRKEPRARIVGIPTEHLSFAAMEFVTGRAFAVGNEDNSVPMAKAWELFEGRRSVLVEKIPWRAIGPELARLPVVANNALRKKGPLMARNQLRLPQRQQARVGIKPIRMAAITPEKRGYVLDWELVSSVNSNLWKGDTTYYIAGDIAVKTNVFEGGCVIKFAPTNTARLLVTGPATFLTTNYSPLILTARDDHSVGQPIGSSTLSGYYANKALELDYYSSGILYDLHDIRVSHATLGIAFFQGYGHAVRNVQLVNCLQGIQSYYSSFHILNGLFHNVILPFGGSGTSSTTGNVQHVTFNQCSNLNSTTLTLDMTNSLLVAVTNITSFTGAYNGTNSDPSVALQVVGAGSNYLASGSAFRNAGTTNIDSTLRSALKQLTTYPPIVVGPLIILANTNLSLSPQAGRDTDTPDLGYHYSPIDYVFGGVYVINSTITVNPGTVVALYSPTNGSGSYYGIGLSDGAKLFSEGLATNVNRFVRYNTVHEQSRTTWNTAPSDHVASDWTGVAHTPEARFRFTDWSMAAADTYHFRGYPATDLVAPFRDCQFFGGKFCSERPKVSVTNCLFHRVATVIDGVDHEINPYFQNCLFYGGSLELYAWSGGTWAFTNNLFYGTAISQDGTISHDYNGYVTNATGQRLTSSATHDVATNSFNFQTGALGRFYQPTNSLFLNAGSTNANLLGLYHYTVLTNNVKETNTIVDIGFHYVATTNGVPTDVDTDGIPDYLEDTSGNGLTDASEYSFGNPVLMVASSLNYIKGSPPKRLDANATVFDLDTPNFGGGQLRVSIASGANANDRLEIRNEGTNAMQVGVSANAVTYGGINIGALSGGSGTNSLVITFNTSAGNAAVQALVRNLTFHNVSNNPTASSRLLQFVLTDGTGGTNSPTFQTINVICPQAVDAMLVIDISASMTTNEFQQAKQAASNFVSHLNFSFDRIGLVSFAGYAYLNSVLTNDGPAVQAMISNLTFTNGTTFHFALDLARTNLTQSSTSALPLLVLLSDGRVGTTNASGDPLETEVNRALALQAASAVKDAGIRLITVAYGTNDGLNNGTNLMRTFASSAADYYYAPSAAQIASNYTVIAQGLCRGSNAPPIVSITDPTNGVTYQAMANVTITALAGDSDGSVTNVEFYSGSTKIGEDAIPPYEFLWSGITAGEYSLKARALDDWGQAGTSAVVYVTVTDPRSRTWTRNVDFAEGSLLNVNFDVVPHQLQLNQNITPYPFVYIACSTRGTIVRIDANTGQILGEYWTAPDTMGRNPSRTTVDRLGNVWVGNRDESGDIGGSQYRGSVTRIGLILGGTRYRKDGSSYVLDPTGEYLKPPFHYSTCQDRDGDGYIRTSRGRANILAWSNTNSVDSLGGVTTAQDEAIINYTRVWGQGTRTVAVDANNDVWVGGWWDSAHEKLSGVTGLPIPGTQFQTNLTGGYGGLVDANGSLWSTLNHGNLLRYDPGSNNIVNLGNQGGTYAIGIDPNTGYIWVTSAGGSIYVRHPNGTVLTNVGPTAGGGKGIAVDASGNVWVAHGNFPEPGAESQISHYRTDGTYVGRVALPCGQFPIGVAVDSNGKVWLANASTHNAMRIDPNGGPRMLNGELNTNGFPIGVVDLTVDLGSGAGPYNYSDMTGYVSLGATAPAGVWTVMHDSGTNGTSWGTAKWTSHEPTNTSIKVEVRAADALAAQTGVYTVVSNGSTFSGLGISGRYIEIRATLRRDFGATNFPVLYDLSIAPGAVQPAIATNAPYLANDDTFVVTQNSSPSVLPALMNDADPAGYALGIWKSSSPMSGTISNTGLALIYRPNTNFFGKDRCVYWVTNGQGGVDRALVTIYVDRIDLARTNFPVANDDFVTVIPNDANTNIVVLTNDVNAARIVYVSQPRYGRSFLETTNPCVGEIKYTPPRLYIGSDSFVYAIVDTNGVSRWATVYIDVKGEAPRPIACGQTLHGELSTNDGRLPLDPAATGDVYTFEGVAGTNVTFYAIGQVSFLRIVSPTGVSLATGSEVWPGLHGVSCTLTTNGTHWLEVYTWATLPVVYDLKFQCDSAYLPEITALETSRTLTNNATIDFGITDWNIAVARTLSIVNAGPLSTLTLSNVAVTPPFSLASAVSGTSLNDGDSTNVTISFQSFDSGWFSGTLTITNNDGGGADGVENPFVLNLRAYANGAFPSVAIITPTNNETAYAGSDLRINVSATPYGGALTQVLFYASNAITGMFQIGRDTNSPYEMVWPNMPLGTHTLYARAADSGGFDGESAPVTVHAVTNIANNPPVAQDDEFTVAMNSATNLLHVLANDSDPDGNTVTIQTNGYVQGTILNAGTHLIYTPPPYGTGTVQFSYTIRDGWGGTARGIVTINVMELPPPTINITSPAQDASFTLPATITINASVSESVSKVAFYAGEEKIGEDASSPYSIGWTEASPGSASLTAVAISSSGISIASAPVTVFVNPKPNNQLPIARIDNLPITVSNVLNTFFTTNYPVVREGLFAVVGTADDPDGADTVTYQLRVKSLDGTLLRALTNQARVTAATLGTLDLSTLRNGVYELELRVRDGGDVSIVRKRFILDSELKIGQFSFSEQDVVIPVNGIPLTVVRTYNSLNPDSGDFGVGWTYAINDLEVQLDEERGWNEDVSGEVFSQRFGGGRNVTLTLPDGRRTTFFYYLRPGGGECGCYQAFWQAPPGIYATLTTLDSATTNLSVLADNSLITSVGIPYWYRSAAGPYTPVDAYDFAGFALTLQDGTRYEIEREYQGPFYAADDEGNSLMLEPRGKPTLKRIVQRSKDRIEIGADRIDHYTPSNQITRSVWIERQDNGLITAIRDPLSGSDGTPVVKYEYDALGNLSQVLRLVDRITGSYLTNRYFYTNATFPHYLTGMEDARGITVARSLYDNSGRLIGLINANGHTNRFEHDTTNRREIVYDVKGRATTNVYDTFGNVTNVISALGQTNHFRYDTNGAMTAHIDPLGNITTYTNDARGNVLSVTLPYPIGADPAKYRTHYTYDQYDQQTSVVLPSGAVQTNQFDGSGNLLSVRDENGNPINAWAYDGNGNAIADVDRFGTNSFRFDASGNPTHFTNSLGQVITSGYDANGNLTNLVDGSSTSRLAYDALGRETTSDYGSGITLTNTYTSQLDWTSLNAPTVGHMERQFDAQGRLQGWVTPNGSTPGFAYDEVGQLTYETNTIGVVTHTTYDAAGRVIAVTNVATGAGIRYAYDSADRRIGETNALGFATRYGYNPDGSLAAMTNAFGTNYWLYSYDTGTGCCGAGAASVTISDPLGRQLKTINSPQGLPLQTVFISGANSVTNTTVYLSGIVSPDQEGEEYPFTVTDEGGRTRTNTYTALGQLETASDLGGNKWTNNYDQASGVLTNIVSPTGESLLYTYDELDNRKATRFPDGNWLTNYFDAANRLASNRLPSGVVLNYKYDDAGRLTNRSSTVGEMASFAYNLNDAVTVMADNTGSTTNSYDTAGRLRGIDYPTGATIRYGFDLLGQITSITNKASTSGTAYVTRYKYDAIGNVTNVTDPFNGVTTFEYDRVGRRTRRILPNSVTTEWQYDWRDRVTNIVHMLDSTTNAAIGYVRGAGGEPTRITREDGTYVDLKYDAALRLTNEARYASGGGLIENIGYAYDAAGNRVRLVKGGTTLTNNVSAGYRITAVKNGGTTVETYAYDDGGRVTSMTRDSATRTFGYNTADQLTAVTNGSAWTTYAHDAQGRRTKAVDNSGAQRRFLVAPTPGSDLESPHLVSDGAGAVRQGYVYVGDEPLLRFDTNGTPTYYLEDGMGSVVGLVDSAGTSVATFHYDGFGNLRSSTGSETNAPSGTGGDFRFHGAWWEVTSDLYHMRAREYDQRLGRFLSRDPVEGDSRTPETFHPYVFVENNPFIHTDPSGQFSISEINLTVALQGGLQGLRTAGLVIGYNTARAQIGSVIGQQIFTLLGAYLPDNINPDKLKHLAGGNAFERLVREALCAVLPNQWPHFEVGVRERDGMPVNNGFGCDQRGQRALPRRGIRRPDVIIGNRPPLIAPGQVNKTWLIMETKIRQSTFAIYKNRKDRGQLAAILRYAKKHEYVPVAAFVSVTKGKGRQSATARALIKKEASRGGVVALVVSLQNARAYNLRAAK